MTSSMPLDRINSYSRMNGGADHEAQTSTSTRRKLMPWRTWIDTHMNWSWFTCSQSTGGIAVLLSLCPKQFDGLQTIGKIIFVFNIVLFLTFISLMVTRWIVDPKTIKQSFINAPECFFFGSFWLTIATIIIGMQRYGEPNTGDWLLVVIRIIFWMYAAITLLSTTIHLVIIFKYTPIVAIEMNSGWFLLIYNAMLTGTVASAIAQSQPPAQRLPIIVAGVGYQGLGWIGSLLMLSFFLAHLLEKGWPAPSQTPGLFMTVGSAGYTIVALIGAARAAPPGYGYFATHPTAAEVLLIMATWVGVFLWIFTLWLFGLALFICLANVVARKDGKWIMPMSYTNTWWAFIFPNVGFTIATIYLGQELESNAVLWVSVAMTILTVAFWILDLFLMAKTIVESLTRDSRIKLS